MQYLFFRVC